MIAAVTLIAILAVVAAVFLGFVIYAVSSNPVPSWAAASRQYPQTQRVPVVVSLTTTPNRLQGRAIKDVLASVMAQDPAPEAIEINIPYEMKRLGTPYTVPQWLIDSAVHIHRCDDFGPATKYLSTLKRYAVKNPDQKILVIDDDMIMPPGLVGAANASMNAHPHSAVCGHGMVLKNKGTPTGVTFSLISFVAGQNPLLQVISQHKNEMRNADDVQAIDIITGYQGYGIRPRFFDIDTLADYADLPPEAFLVDDMVISARLAQRNIPRIVCASWKPFTLVSPMAVMGFVGEWLRNLVKPDPLNEALSSGVNRSDHNNNVVVRHFWQVW